MEMARPCLTHGRHSSAFHQATYITQCLASALLFLWFLVSLRAHTVMSAVLPPFCNTSAQWLGFMALCYSLCCFDLPPLVYNSRIHFFFFKIRIHPWQIEYSMKGRLARGTQLHLTQGSWNCGRQDPQAKRAGNYRI